VPFNAEVRALNKNLHKFEEYGSLNTPTEFWRKLEKGRTGHCTEKYSGNS